MSAYRARGYPTVNSDENGGQHTARNDCSSVDLKVKLIGGKKRKK